MTRTTGPQARGRVLAAAALAIGGLLATAPTQAAPLMPAPVETLADGAGVVPVQYGWHRHHWGHHHGRHHGHWGHRGHRWGGWHRHHHHHRHWGGRGWGHHHRW